MSIKNKVQLFIAKHGFTVKSWLIAFIICPPAAVFMPFKMHSISMIARLLMIVLTIVVHGILISGSFTVVASLLLRSFRSIPVE